MGYGVVRYDTVRRDGVWCATAFKREFGEVRFGKMRYGTVEYGLVWYGSVWYGTAFWQVETI